MVHSEKQWMTWGHVEWASNSFLVEEGQFPMENISQTDFKNDEEMTGDRRKWRVFSSQSPPRSWKSDCFILLHYCSLGPWGRGLTFVLNSRADFFLAFSGCPDVLTGSVLGPLIFFFFILSFYPSYIDPKESHMHFEWGKCLHVAWKRVSSEAKASHFHDHTERMFHVQSNLH